MKRLIVLEDPRAFQLEIPGIEIVRANEYLTDEKHAASSRVRVFNLCRTYGYQTVGYYVSLLAMARGHRPLPSVTTLQDLKMQPVVRVLSEDLDAFIQKAFLPIKTDHFVLSIYFGRNLAKRYDRLCHALFSHFPVPFLRAEFSRTDRWRLDRIKAMAQKDIPEAHREFVAEQALRFFERPPRKRTESYRYDLGILVNPDEPYAPSDTKAIEKFIRAAKHFSIRATVIGKEDSGRIPEFDGLFIRETTAVNHHTFQFARKAEAEGLAVIDDPESIVRCTNKVYLAETFRRHGIPHPKTVIVHRNNAQVIGDALGFPCVLKRPDSSFSLGVAKANDRKELETILSAYLERSELIVAQAYTPSEFDWRIGVLGGRALYAAKYFMARGHWQIEKADDGNHRRRYGKTETVAVENAPVEAVRLAEKCATLIGTGLYGVDIKQVRGNFVVIEINDNPSIDAGCEDSLLKDELYHRIMGSFFERMESRGRKEGRL